MQTQINGKPAEWTDAIRALWATIDTDRPKRAIGTVTLANYFTPRPYVDEYNRGSEYEGFTYTQVETDDPHYPKVYQWSRRSDGPPICPDCHERHWSFYGCFPAGRS